MEFVVRKLGMLGYDDALKLQEELLSARIKNLIPDQLLFLQHFPVITMGRRAKLANVLATEEILAQEGIIVRKTNRGGDVTYQGPGQLVGYVILKLPPWVGLHHLVWNIEESLMILLESYGVQVAKRKAGFPGLWISEAKIAAIGLALREQVTMHGFALNVAPMMAHFAFINQCGLGKGTTSLQKLGVQVKNWGELESRMELAWRSVSERFPLRQFRTAIEGYE